MRELTRILEAYNSTDFSKQKAALATVIRVIGSSYRSPGARMYITDDGHWTGSISGGCLEGDALRKSRKVMNDGQPKVITYDTTEENNELGVGLGCEGVIYVLLVPVKEDSELMGQLKWVDYQEEEITMATIVGTEVNVDIALGTQIIMHRGEILDENLQYFDNEIKEELHHVFVTKKSCSKVLSNSNGSVEVFFELFEPAIDLLLFGGGYDAQPLAKLGNDMGWKVSVVDDCVAHLLPANFPNATVIGCKPEAVSENVYVKPYSAAVLMYHSYSADYKALKELLNSGIVYIGILGPKKKGEKMMEQLRNEGIELSDFDEKRIHYPVGLDIGADTPEEIALSVIAEIKSVFSGRNGGMLRYRNDSIHAKDEMTGEVYKQVYSQERNMLIESVE